MHAVEVDKVLDATGLQMMDSAGWIEQAKLAAKGDMKRLAKSQEQRGEKSETTHSLDQTSPAPVAGFVFIARGPKVQVTCADPERARQDVNEPHRNSYFVVIV